MPKYYNFKKIKRMRKNMKKDLSQPFSYFILFIYSIIIGSNISYSLRTFFNTETFPINGNAPPYRGPASFPHNLCSGTDKISPQCFTLIKWLSQTISLSMISWRKLLLANPQTSLNKDNNIFNTKIPQGGNIMELCFILLIPIIIPFILSLGPIVSIILTYCASVNANCGMFFTLLFTFIPILLFLIAPIISLANVFHVLYILLLKPLFSVGGWKNLMQNVMKFMLIPILLFIIYIINHYKVLAWPITYPFAFVIGFFYIYKMISGNNEN